MSLEGQRLQSDRYKVVPRTLSFLLRKDQVLLLQLAEDRGAWSGKFNGIGGHIERGEDPKTAAKREILEETGYSPASLRLAGTVIVDTGTDPGIMIYVYAGEILQTFPPHPNSEGSLHWIKLSNLNTIDLVEDLPQVLPKTLEAYKRDATFSALYAYDEDGTLQIQFHQDED
jgi:8-oxo-dGTP diphosphatase